MEEGICPPELLMTCESSKSRQELVSRIWKFSLQACFSGASESAPLIFQEPCEQVAGIYCAATERPVVKAHLPLQPFPVFPLEDALFFTVLCFSSQVLGSRSEQS